MDHSDSLSDVPVEGAVGNSTSPLQLGLTEEEAEELRTELTKVGPSPHIKELELLEKAARMRKHSYEGTWLMSVAGRTAYQCLSFVWLPDVHDMDGDIPTQKLASIISHINKDKY